MRNSIFQFTDIFKIKSGFYNKKPVESYGEGSIPFIGATAFNNGMTDSFNIKTIQQASKTGDDKNAHIDAKIFKGNSIVVTNNGSVGYAYYQPSSFTCSHDVNPLYLLHGKLNKYSALYLSTSIQQQRVCFEYARKWRPKRMKKSKILLPVNSDQKPDYDYMESYIKGLQAQKEKEYLAYIFKRLDGLKDVQETVKLEGKKWVSFYLSDLFDFEKGNQNNMSGLQEGCIPLVSAKKGDNAYKSFVACNGKRKFKGNSLTLNNDGDGGAGFSFYQPTNYLLDSHVTALYAKNMLNRFVLLFISRCVTLQRGKFGHGYAINAKRLKAFKIMLPVNDQNQPDYEYMENYMKYLEYQKLKAYLDFKGVSL